MMSIHGVSSDSSSTPPDSFDAPMRRSMKMIGDSTIVTGFANSLFYTAAGTFVSLALTVAIAYPLSRKDFWGRGGITLGVIFTMLFAGGIIPTYLVVQQLGLLDTRYRYSDEASSTEMQGVTLLGILPNLPDRLSDPEQAAIAVPSDEPSMPHRVSPRSPSEAIKPTAAPPPRESENAAGPPTVERLPPPVRAPPAGRDPPPADCPAGRRPCWRASSSACRCVFRSSFSLARARSSALRRRISAIRSAIGTSKRSAGRRP